MRSGLRFFGLTVAQSALDQSGDGLPDIAVGSKGAVLLLRFSYSPHPANGQIKNVFSNYNTRAAS